MAIRLQAHEKSQGKFFCTLLSSVHPSVCTVPICSLWHIFVVIQWCHLSTQMFELATHNCQLSSAVLEVLLREIAVKSVRW